MVHRKVLWATMATRAWCRRVNKHVNYTFPEDLSGMCAIAAAHLLQQLHHAGYRSARIVGNDCHFFVEWRGYVIDATATQFNLPPVYIAHRKQMRKQLTTWQHHYYEREYVFSTAEQLRQHQRKDGWPHGQTVWRKLAAGDFSMPIKQVTRVLGL